jgi:hypothetical protein
MTLVEYQRVAQGATRLQLQVLGSQTGQAAAISRIVV